MKKKVLVVDPEESTLRILTILFHKCGVDVETATNGIDALDLFQSKVFDGITTDFVMAKMGGMELLRRVREVDQTIPVGIIGGFTFDSFKPADREFLETNTQGFVRKPFGADELKEKVFRWFGPPDKPL